MWIFLNNAMVSVVEHRLDPRVLVVRARLKGDLQRVFGKKALVMETKLADYRFRTYVSRPMLKKAMSEAVDRIDYENFKNSVTSGARHDAYMSVWSAMLTAQLREMPGRLRSWTSLFSSRLSQGRKIDLDDEHITDLDDLGVEYETEENVMDVMERNGFGLRRNVSLLGEPI